MKKILIVILALISTISLYSQTYNAHLIGIKGALNISGVAFAPPKDGSSTVMTRKNYAISYIYYHNLWKSMPYFGFQAELYFQEQGYQLDENKVICETVEVPFISQFHIDFWKMRLLINAGGFAGYRKSKSDGFAETDYRYDAGFIGGAGLAFVLKPFEFHIEGNYHYSLTYLYDPQKSSQINLSFTHPNQLLLSFGIYYQLFSK
jgi:hypothetical protein